MIIVFEIDIHIKTNTILFVYKGIIIIDLKYVDTLTINLLMHIYYLVINYNIYY